MKDEREYTSLKERLEGWRIQTSDEEGLFEVFSPEKSDCKALRIFRLNLAAGKQHTITSGGLEMNGVIIEGAACITGATIHEELAQFDAFYISAGLQLTINAVQDTVVYIGAAEGIENGMERVIRFDMSLPLGDVHQIHGKGVGEREVMFTCAPQFPAQRLICGLTWSRNGTWTGWPPHQHEKDLEEAYCYFGMDAPHMGLHISYLQSGAMSDAVVHTVQSGTMVLAPRGYHPTVATPGTKNGYFWVMAALSHAQRRYDVAQTDPQLIDFN